MTTFKLTLNLTGDELDYFSNLIDEMKPDNEEEQESFKRKTSYIKLFQPT